MTITNNYLITVVGPTAIGKTSMAIKLANHFNCEIISSDSRQFYKEMSIGTAVPFEEELQSATHHFIQDKSIQTTYSVGDFERDALDKLNELFADNSIQVMVGGSGLFVNAVLFGLDKFPDIDPNIRTQLNEELKELGIEHLQEKLKKLDPIHYEKIALQNPQRLIRALEVCVGSGKPYSSFLKQNDNKRNFIPIIIGLEAEREIMYERINLRVDQMMENGLLKEVENLKNYQELNALQTVGYRELFSYLNGEISLDFAVEEIKKNTRRFAKRQLTWFKKLENVIWVDYTTSSEDIIKRIETITL